MIAPLYISELSPRKLRGSLVSFFEVAYSGLYLIISSQHRPTALDQVSHDIQSLFC